MRVVVGRDGGHLRAERPEHPRHTVKVLHLAPNRDRLTPEALTAHLAARLPATGVLCDRIGQVRRGRLLPQAWVRVRPDIADHVDHVIVGVPGGPATLDDVIGCRLAQPLDRRRPLWSATLVDGPGLEGQAVVLRVHHAVGDGPQISGMLRTLFGLDSPVPATLVPDPEPATARSVAAVGLRRAGELAGRWRELIDAIRQTRRASKEPAVDPWVDPSVGPLEPAAAPPYTSQVLPWTHGSGPGRVVASVSLPLDEVRRQGRVGGATVNEVLLTLVGGAARRSLEAERFALTRPLTASGSLSRVLDPPLRGNHHTAASFALHVEEADPARRLALVASSSRAGIDRARRVDPRIEFGVRELPGAFEALYALGLWIGRRLDRPTFSLIATTVAGPPGPLAIVGIPVDRLVSYGLITEDIGLNVTGWRVADRLEIGITTRPDTIDPAGFAVRLAEELAALAAAHEAAPPVALGTPA